MKRKTPSTKCDSKQKRLPFVPLKHEVRPTTNPVELPTSSQIAEWKAKLHEKYVDWVEEPCLPLERLHPHPRDSSLVFIDTNHAHMYFFYPDLAPNPLALSVTALKKLLLPDKDWRGVAAECVAGEKFQTGVSPWTPYMNTHGVLLAWELNREQAARQGTVFHRRVEGRLNEPFIDPDKFPAEHAVTLEIQKTCSEAAMQSIQEEFDRFRRQAIWLLERGRLPVFQSKQNVIVEQDRKTGTLQPLEKEIVEETTVPADFFDSEEESISKEPVVLSEMEELVSFDKFWRTFFAESYPGYRATLYRTEMRIWDKDALVPGTIDCVVVLHPLDGTSVPKECANKTILLILDWKRSGKLAMETRYAEYCNPPFSMLPVCNGSEFTFQLNAYKYILEKCYEIEGKPVHVMDMYACVFNRCIPTGCIVQQLRDVSQGMHKFMEQRIQSLQK
jgi:hypothetical protein